MNRKIFILLGVILSVALIVVAYLHIYGKQHNKITADELTK